MYKSYKKVDGIYIGSICNAKCSFCIDRWGGKYKNNPKLEEINIIKKQIDDFINDGVTDCIIYEGGDFSIHPGIFEILDYGNLKGIKQTFQTNGLKLVDKNFVFELKKRKIDVINISLHITSEKLYDKIMGTKNGFLKVLKGIKNCKELGITVNINFVIINDNIDEIYKILILSLKLGIKQLSFYLYIPPLLFSKKKNLEFMVNPFSIKEKINNMLICTKVPGCVEMIYD